MKTQLFLAVAIFTVLAAATHAETSLTIAPGFPYGLVYVYECDSPGMNATEYTFDFGDGTNETKPFSIYYPYNYNTTTNQLNANVTGVQAYHVYPANSTYTVSCTAVNNTSQQSASITVQAATNHTTPYIDVTPLGNYNYQFACYSPTFPTQYGSYGITGPYGYSFSQEGASHVLNLPGNGDYSLSCFVSFFDHKYDPSHYQLCDNYAGECEYIATICGRSHSGCGGADAQTTISVTNESCTAQSPCYSANLHVQDLGNNKIRATCDTSDFDAHTITLNYGDNSQETVCYGCGVYTNGPGLTHTYNQSGNYELTCALSTFDYSGIPKRANATQLVIIGTADTNNQTNETVTPVNNTGSEVFTPTANLYVKEWYPKDNDYVFVCGNNFNATIFSWYYGDGEKLLDIANGDTYHRYKSTGTFDVSCTATSNAYSASANMVAPVGNVTYCDPGVVCGMEVPPQDNTNNEPVEWQSTLMLAGGTVNGQAVNAGQRTITVAPSASITGSLDFNIHTTYGSNAVMVFAGTSSWGDNAASCVDYGNIATPGDYGKTIPVSFTAPTEPGEYYLLFQYRGEFTAEQVCSMTNWSGDDGTKWNDGNDMADWNTSMIDAANQNGRVMAQLEYSNGMRDFTVPAQAIKVIVQEPVQLTPEPTCLLSATPTVTNGYVYYDRLVGEQRQFVWIQNNQQIHWLTATRDGTLSIENSWNNGIWNSTFPSASFCLDTACVTPTSRTISVNSTCAPPPSPSVELRPYPGFPQDNKVVFECVANGFTPSTYTWNFGDNTTATSSVYNVYHTYPDAGTYEASCSAENAGQDYTGAMNITLHTPFSPSLIQGEDVHINSTLTVGGNAGEQWATYIQLLNQTGNEFTVSCGIFGHQTNRTYYWSIPSGVEVLSTSADTSTKVLRAQEPGTYQIICSQGVYDPRYYSEMWNPSSPLYQNGQPAVSYGNGGITGYGVSLNVPVASNTCYSSIMDLNATCDNGAPVNDTLGSDGCRYITCSNGLTFNACNTQASGTQHYTISAVSGTGFGTACVGSNVCLNVHEYYNCDVSTSPWSNCTYVEANVTSPEHPIC